MRPIDESSGKIDAHFMANPTVKVTPIKVEKVKKPTMWPCHSCGKLTRSHRYPDGAVLCHGCFDRKTEEEQNGFATAHSNRTSKGKEQTV
jgi:hypothetical protein